MSTTNYSLPTLESTALFDLVTDYNALANATDAALAQVAGTIPTETITEMEGQISALQTLTGSQGSQITTLQSQMTTANGNISTLQSGLETANSNIGTLQSGLQSTNSDLTKVKNYMSSLFNFSVEEVTQFSNFSVNSGQKLYIFYNPDKSLIKIAGSITHTGNATRQAIPGTSMYGFQCVTDLVIPTNTAIEYNSVGIAFNDASRGYVFFGAQGLTLGTDGKLYLYPSTTQQFNISGAFNITFLQSLLTVKDLNLSSISDK
jgi:X-X-X-Leu-X-X-Gly heptad repeat protein